MNFLSPAGQTCDATLDDAIAQGFPKNPAACPQACENDLRGNGVDLFGCQSRTERIVSRNDCIDSVGSPLTTTANGDLRADKLRCNPASSVLTIVRRLPGGAVISTDRASISCDAQVHSGSFHLDLLRMQADGPITAAPTSFSNIRVGLLSPLVGSIDTSGLFVFDVSQSNFALTATSAGARVNYLFAPTASVVGNYDRGQGRFAADLAMQSEDGLTDLIVHLEGLTENRAPSAVITGTTVAECINRAGLIELSALGSTDPDGTSLNSFLWYEGSTPLGSGASLSVRLPLGQHTIRLLAFDGVSLGEATKVVDVVDTQPPVLAVTNALACAWPPNHKMLKLVVGRDVIATSNDLCEGPGIVQGFTAVTSSQSDNGLGDGDTVGDVVFSPHAACLRVERSGVGGQARKYQLVVSAIDGTGNNTSVTTEILVGHDQGGSHRCEPNLSPEFIDGPDADCSAGVASVPQNSVNRDQPQVSNGQGCLAVPETTTWLGALSSLWLLRVRGRARPQRGLVVK